MFNLEYTFQPRDSPMRKITPIQSDSNLRNFVVEHFEKTIDVLYSKTPEPTPKLNDRGYSRMTDCCGMQTVLYKGGGRGKSSTI